MEKSNQFVTLPNEVVECEEISPKTLVIYCALKRHMNEKTRTCYPQIKTIAKESGCGKDAVLAAIKELVDNEFISVENRPGQSNIYKFSTHKGFEPISYDFLDNDQIKLREKAYLIAQQKNMFIKSDSGFGITSLSTKEIAKLTHMSVPTVLSCENKLMKAGYMQIANSNLLDKESGTHEKLRMYLLQLYNMAALTFRQTQKNTEDIEDLKAENKELRKEIEILKRAVFKNIKEDIVL